MAKKIFALLLAAMLVLSLAACDSKTDDSSNNGDNSNNDNSANTEVSGLTEAIAEYPALVTSGGQSADYQMIATVMEKQDMEFTTNNLSTSADLGDAKTLIVLVGGSSKGLGAAGIDADGELARLDELMKAAKDAGVTIIAMHTGGEARRGDLSDKFIAPVFDMADYAIVVSSGDTDGLMAGLCSKNGIPMDSIESISDVVSVLPAAFK